VPPGSRSHPSASRNRTPSADAGIVDAAVAAAEKDAPCPGVERGADQFADAAAGGAAGIAHVAGHEAKPRRRRKLDDRGIAVAPAQETVMRIDGLADRSGHRQSVDRAAGGLDQRVDEPFAAIDQRRLHDRRVRQGAAYAFGDAVGDPAGAEAFLETRWCDEDGHRHGAASLIGLSQGRRAGAADIPDAGAKLRRRREGVSAPCRAAASRRARSRRA
jgi:hypothetical protein